MVDETTLLWVESGRWLPHRHRWVVNGGRPGAAVGRDRLVVDGLVYDFETLDPAVADDGTRFARPGRHHVLVPMRRDWSLDVRTHAPGAFTQALRASYREWSAARAARP